MLGLQDSQSTTFTLGDNFLRNVYMIADYENMEIGLAVANHSASNEDIQVVSTGIPNANQPVSSLEYGKSVTTLVVQSTIVTSSIPSSQSLSTAQTIPVSTTKDNKASDESSISTDARTVSSIPSSTHNYAARNEVGVMAGVFAVLAALL